MDTSKIALMLCTLLALCIMPAFAQGSDVDLNQYIKSNKDPDALALAMIPYLNGDDPDIRVLALVNIILTESKLPEVLQAEKELLSNEPAGEFRDLLELAIQVSSGINPPGNKTRGDDTKKIPGDDTKKTPGGDTNTTGLIISGNNELGKSAQIPSGSSLKQAISPAGSSNRYKIKTDSNGIISVKIDGVPKDMRPQVKLYDKNFVLFEEKLATAAGDVLIFKKDVPVPGWIYIAVYDAEGKAHSDPYSLKIDFQPVQDEFDPNNALGDAAEIKAGQAVTASICPAGEADWYRMKTDSNGILSVNIAGVPKDMRSQIKLYDRNAVLFDEKIATAAGEDLKFEKDIPMPGWIYMAVYDADGKARAEPYTMTIDFKPVQDSFDPNNALGDAAQIQAGQAVTASICPAGEADWYKMETASSKVLSVSITGVPGDMRSQVKLFDKNFILFEEKMATAAGDDLKFEKDVPAPGWVYVAVWDAEGKAHSEPYTLAVA